MRNITYSNRTFINLCQVAVLILISIVPFLAQAAPSLNIVETVANLSPANDQVATLSTTTANVVGVLASTTFNVATVPTEGATTTIGDCTITFTAVGGSTDDETDCTDDLAQIDLDEGVGNDPRDENAIAAALRNLSDVGQSTRTYTVSGTTTQVVFQTTAPESVAGLVTFSDGTAGAIVTLATTTGIVPVAQVMTVTIGGTVEVGDVFSVVLPGPVTASTSVTSATTTTAEIAAALRTAIVASAGYGSQPFTAATSTNTIIFTAKSAGTGFTISASASNRSAVAQVITITPGTVESGYDFTVTINSTDYTYRSVNSSVQTIVEGLVAELAGASAVSCTEDNTTITCTSVTPGTAFTYAASVAQVPSSSRSGGGRTRAVSVNPVSSPVVAPATPAPGRVDVVALRAQVAAVIAAAEQAGITVPAALRAFIAAPSVPPTTLEVRDLTLGSRGEDVMALQSLLITANRGAAAAALAQAGASGYFGPLTQAALAELQTALGITPAQGYFGPLTRAQLSAAAIPGVWW